MVMPNKISYRFTPRMMFLAAFRFNIPWPTKFVSDFFNEKLGNVGKIPNLRNS